MLFISLQPSDHQSRPDPPCSIMLGKVAILCTKTMQSDDLDAHWDLRCIRYIKFSLPFLQKSKCSSAMTINCASAASLRQMAHGWRSLPKGYNWHQPLKWELCHLKISAEGEESAVLSSSSFLKGIHHCLANNDLTISHPIWTPTCCHKLQEKC